MSYTTSRTKFILFEESAVHSTYVSMLVQLQIQCVPKVAVHEHFGHGTRISLSVPKLPLQCAVVSLYSVVKQRFKCNISKVCNCLIPFLLTMFRRHHIQHLLQVHSEFPNALYYVYKKF
jgi:hypothetical protein